jgi:hypothetical protein
MKSVKLLLLILCTSLISSAQSESFSKITLMSTGKIFLQQGDSDKVVVNASGSNDRVRTEIKNGTLYIKSPGWNDYHITMRKIEGIIVSGSGEITSETPIKSDELSIVVSGSGKINLQLDVKKLDIAVSGEMTLDLSGTAEETGIGISGAGKVNAYDLKTISCNANISGVGKCNIDVTDTLTTHISGMGTINYKAAPKVINGDVSGVGRINDKKSIGEKRDTTRFKFGHSDVLIISNDSLHRRRKHKEGSPSPIWKGFEIGFNNYVNASGSAAVPPAYSFLDVNTGKSVYVSLNLLQKDIQFGKSNFWFFTGLGISWNNYRFDNNVVLNPGTLLNSSYDTTSGRSYQKSKLTVSWITAPLMFEVFTSHKRKDAFNIGAGGMLGYRIGSHSKTKYEEDGHTYKPKVYDDFNLNSFRYGFRVAVGYRKFNVFADLYASSLFKENKSPIVYPIDFGITLIGF